jgi:hypothetical protein
MVMVTLVSEKRLRMFDRDRKGLDRNTTLGREGEAPSGAIPTIYRISFRSLSIVLRCNRPKFLIRDTGICGNEEWIQQVKECWAVKSASPLFLDKFQPSVNSLFKFLRWVIYYTYFDWSVGELFQVYSFYQFFLNYVCILVYDFLDGDIPVANIQVWQLVRSQTITLGKYRLNNKNAFSYLFRKSSRVFVISYMHPPQHFLASCLPGKESWYIHSSTKCTKTALSIMGRR